MLLKSDTDVYLYLSYVYLLENRNKRLLGKTDFTFSLLRISYMKNARFTSLIADFYFPRPAFRIIEHCSQIIMMLWSFISIFVIDTNVIYLKFQVIFADIIWHFLTAFWHLTAFFNNSNRIWIAVIFYYNSIHNNIQICNIKSLNK